MKALKTIGIMMVVLMLTLLMCGVSFAVPITDTDGGGLLGTNNALLVATTASRTITEGQVTLGAATATLIVVARTSRLSVTIQNHGANAMYCGSNAAITAANGPILLPQYGVYVFDRTKSSIYCISTAGTTLGFFDQY